MGDRCFVQMRVRSADLMKFLEIMGDTPDYTEPARGATTVEFHEANYGLYPERIAAAEAGCVFSGHHTAGEEYEGRLFAAADGKIAEVDMVRDSPAVLVTATADGKARMSEDDAENTQVYFALDKKVTALCEAELTASTGLEIEKTLVLSTAHMPESHPDFGELRASPHEYGYIVFLLSSHPSPEASGNLERAPDWIKPAILLADNNGCNYINFDRDGYKMPILPTFDW